MQLIGVQTLLGPNSFSAAFFVKHGFWVNLIVFSFMYIAVGIILAILAFTFLVVGFKFLIRIVMLWIAIIASPLALVAGAMGRNKSGSAEKLFKLWYSTLIEYSFHPAVFLFMFWIVNSFAIELATSGNGNKDGILNAAFSDLGAITAGGDTGSFLVPIAAAVASISIRLGLVVILLFVAMKASDKIASSGSSGARSAAGWTGNKLSNAVAWGGRNSFGRLGYSYAQSNTGRALAAHSLLGKGLVVGARKLSGANYDVRGVKGLNTAILQTTGAKLSNAPATSFEKAYDAGVASRVNFANTLKPNERKLSDAYTQAVKNLKDDGKKQVLIQASAEYADAIEAQKDGSGERGAVKAAKEKYDAAVKDSGVIADAEKIAGANNHKTYADFMTKRSWYNGYGTNKNGTPFIISSTDKEAARKIRGEAKNNPDRLKKALESVNEENKKKKDGKGTPNTDQPNPRDGGSGGSSGGSGTGPTPQNGGGPSSRASVPSDTTSKVQDTMFKNQAKAAAEANETVVGAISSLQESNEKIGRKNIEEVQGLRKDMKGLHSAINEMREASATAPHLDASSGSVTGVLRGTPATDVLHTPTNLHANTTATAARTTPVPRVIPPQGQQPVKTPTTAIKPTVDEQVTPQVPLDGETIKPPPLHTLRAAPLPPNHPPASDK